MRFFRFIPGGGFTEEGEAPVNDVLESIADRLEELGAHKAVLIVEDPAGVTVAVGRLNGWEDSPKATADLLLRLALDAKDMLT